MSIHFDSLLIAFATACFLLYRFKALAPVLGLMDTPGSRTVHNGAVPLVGGLAMYLAFVLGLLTLEVGLNSLRGFFAGSLILVVVGTVDDIRELSSRSRFLVQIVAALFMVYWGDIQLNDLGRVASDDLLNLGILSVPITVFSVVGVINALNMSDGVDGLAGSIGLVVLAILASFSIFDSDWQSANILLLLVVVVIAFLGFNFRIPGRKRALLFMGDAGSMFLGFAIAWYLIKFSQGEGRLFPPVLALWILTVPLLDTVSIMFRRVMAGRSPFSADREHFHHAWLLSGFSTSCTVYMIVLSMLALSAIGITAWQYGASEQMMFALFMLLFVAYFAYMAMAWRRRKFLDREICRRTGECERRVLAAEDSGFADEDRRRTTDRRH